MNTVTDKKTENYNILKEILPFWNKLTNEQKNSLAENTAFAKYAKKSNIVSDTCIGTGAIYVKSGMLRAYLLSEEGREVTLYRMTSGDFCVLSSACASDDMPFDIFLTPKPTPRFI